ncbi:Alpha/Beta hydrolase protein [Phyllosticta capitalensis]
MWPRLWRLISRSEAADADARPKTPDIQEEGIIVLRDDGPDAIVDICFVHGLGGHLTKTWSRGDCCWPKDLLPNTISNDNRIKIRVLSYGYNAQPVKLSGGSSNGRVQGFARTLMDELGSSRRMLGGKHCSRRIIFVGHSLGGLVIKSTICQSKQYNPGELERNIFDCTAGTIFIGTPHHGSDFARWTKYLNGIFAMAQRPVNQGLMDDMRSRTVQLKNLSDDFDVAAREIKKVCCYETESTFVAGTDWGHVVSDTSAKINGAKLEAITADHVNMCKFDKEDDPNYRAATRGIIAMVDEISESNTQQKEAEENHFQKVTNRDKP